MLASRFHGAVPERYRLKRNANEHLKKTYLWNTTHMVGMLVLTYSFFGRNVSHILRTLRNCTATSRSIITLSELLRAAFASEYGCPSEGKLSESIANLGSVLLEKSERSSSFLLLTPSDSLSAPGTRRRKICNTRSSGHCQTRADRVPLRRTNVFGGRASFRAADLQE